MAHQLDLQPLSLQDLQSIFHQNAPLGLSPDAAQRVRECYDFLHAHVEQSPDTLIYGVNTGFGSLCNVRISPDQLEALQHNLIMSHACGMGEEVPAPIVRLMLLLKARNLAYGHSAVQPQTLARLLDFYNKNVLPVVYQQGSLGASGDLAPLAHLSLPLIGLGEVWADGARVAAKAALQQHGWQPLRLAMKEGLALLNGTQFCLSYGVWCAWEAERLMRVADLVAAMSADGFACVLSPFDPRLHQIRAHRGQIDTAAQLRDWLEGSALAATPKTTVQDPYAFRCVPQVHGASKDALRYVSSVLETEINSITDNPTVFYEDSAVLSGGNFHAQPLALVLDFLAMALAELGSISERRVYQLISGQRGLPPFLTQNSGLNSGMMIAQYTAASIVSQNKQYCTPASVDSIVSCNGQEDHVSMGANAATKLYKVVENVWSLLGIEFMAAAQALHLRGGQTSPKIQAIVEKYRAQVAPLEADRVLGEDLRKTARFIRTLF